MSFGGENCVEIMEVLAMAGTPTGFIETGLQIFEGRGPYPHCKSHVSSYKWRVDDFVNLRPVVLVSQYTEYVPRLGWFGLEHLVFALR